MCPLPLTGRPAERGRRQSQRFPISVPAEYILDDAKQSTTTANISRSGVFIHAKEKLPVGRSVRLAIDWPVALDGRCQLRLVVFGHIVRSQNNGAAICIQRHEFRLQSTSSPTG
jgi:PilZ domain-containing protein